MGAALGNPSTHPEWEIVETNHSGSAPMMPVDPGSMQAKGIR
jgi:hypothetical protein